MLGKRLDLDIHGSDGFTTIPRIVAMVALVGFLAIGLQLGLQAIYAGRILPGVVVAGQKLGGKTLADARLTLRQQADSYKLELRVDGKDYILKPSDIGLAYDIETTLSAAYMQGRTSWFLPLHTEPLAYSYSLDRHQALTLAGEISSEVGVAPIDAGVLIRNGRVSTAPDKSGITIDKVGLMKLIERDVASPSGNIIPVEPSVVEADIRIAALNTTLQETKTLMSTPIVLSYGEQTFIPTEADIGQWINFEKIHQDTSPSLAVRIDTAKISAYVQTVARRIDKAPVVKKVTVENGVSKVVQEGVEGLAINRDVLVTSIADAVASHKALTKEITAGIVPFKTQSTTLVSLDLGRYIEINLSRQQLWVWQDHSVIYESPITSGATGAGLGTVTGLFSIYSKTTNTFLRGVDYSVPVDYWMPFYLGYGLHDASWRNGKFGGQDYYYGGSHGCVNLPDVTAAFIYNWSTIGTPVWVHK